MDTNAIVGIIAVAVVFSWFGIGVWVGNRVGLYLERAHRTSWIVCALWHFVTMMVVGGVGSLVTLRILTIITGW